MTPRKAGRRKSGKGRRVKTFAVVNGRGLPISDAGTYLIGNNKATAAANAACYQYAKARVVPCEILIGRRK